ncbi:MAG: endonuclease MutS2 [Christensenellaceae bacterium]|nr:endonuclease MutS2 [Christensenellaceae bacterium]
MNSKSLKTLEFQKILSAASAHAISVPAKDVIRGITPSSNIDEITLNLEEVSEADKALFIYAINPGFGFDDVTQILEKAGVMSTLSMGELLKISALLRCARNFKASMLRLKNSKVRISNEVQEELKLLATLSEAVHLDNALQEEIDGAIKSDSEMNDDASVDLRSLRAKIRRQSDNIKVRLANFVNSPNYAKYIQDNIVTIRGDRYVIPVKSEFRGYIPGLIHDQSASGQTIYVEPMAIVEMNNALKTHLIEEEREIERILRQFTVKISNKLDLIKSTFDGLVYLDVVFAKAKYAASIKAVKPLMNNSGITRIIKGRHPIIASESVVPTSISVGQDYDILFITGPNTGGKTVALKLVGLLNAMACAGLFVPALEAELCVYDDIFCDIGDEQSIEQNLSTFSSHIANIVRITESATNRSLVLLDELGAGTDPAEGAALAVAISNFLKELGCRAIITTHYNELKEYAFTTERVENACMEFDPVTYGPTYKLSIGSPGTSNAIMIAQRLGLNTTIIEIAKAGISSDKVQFENVLLALEKSRQAAAIHEEKSAVLHEEAERMMKNAEAERNKLMAQREKLNESVKKETKRMVDEAMEEANSIIATMKAMLDAPSEEDLFKARALRKSLTKYVVDQENEFAEFVEVLASDTISEGDKVIVRPLKAEGIVVGINYEKDVAVVMLGKMRSNFKINDLVKLDTKETKPLTPPRAITDADLRRDSFCPEINLIGKTVHEAEIELDAYIDKAVIAGINQIRIIHGYGTGRLRDAVRRLLKSNSAILSYKAGNFNEGAGGVTIALMRR